MALESRLAEIVTAMETWVPLQEGPVEDFSVAPPGDWVQARMGDSGVNAFSVGLGRIVADLRSAGTLSDSPSNVVAVAAGQAVHERCAG